MLVVGAGGEGGEGGGGGGSRHHTVSISEETKIYIYISKYTEYFSKKAKNIYNYTLSTLHRVEETGLAYKSILKENRSEEPSWALLIAKDCLYFFLRLCSFPLDSWSRFFKNRRMELLRVVKTRP